MSQKWVDLSHLYYEGMHPGKTNPKLSMHIETFQEVEEDKDRPNMQRFTILSHQGTHVDSPRHVFEKGKTIDEIPLEAFVGTGVVLNIPKGARQMITVDDLEEATPSIESGDIVAIHTGWEETFDSDDYMDNPYLTEEAATWLVNKGIRILGVDMINVDVPLALRTPENTSIVHRKLLKNDILIVENLANLSAVAGKRVTLAFFPLKIKGADGSPTRAFALVD